MAGMFYSIGEVAAKLGKSEDEIRQIVKSGRLREFRDGPNLLFKVDEVNSLMSDSFAGGKPTEKPAAPKSEEAEAEEILLAPESETPIKESEELQLTDADTQIVEEGIKVLGDTDSLGKGGSDETFKGLGSGSGPGSPGKEASLEEIEKDVSLDTFGSGSGLLDLSLQADDTSLGGILDEIYAPGAGGEGKASAEAEPAAAESAGSAMEIAAEAEMQFPEPQMPSPALAAAMAFAEPEPDAMSNALGLMLLIPFVAVIYTAMVAIAGFSNLNPAILKLTQGFIWYIVIGMAVASGIIMAVGATMGGEKKPKAPKPPKIKKEKPAKPVKEKKGK